ncbi:hypothetical protein UUU_21940 [Klebsiella pneumoniae subsp. pneumoniae DSM 30104 = JCM 1662 = NBRC 14940]|nr:hypothetical protein UUU_21940 [Klebsiella pneumoniae subsp. pneumoniae DSM 30104 = JCM 1662 = NBRC 14940]
MITLATLKSLLTVLWVHRLLNAVKLYLYAIQTIRRLMKFQILKRLYK